MSTTTTTTPTSTTQSDGKDVIVENVVLGDTTVTATLTSVLLPVGHGHRSSERKPSVIPLRGTRMTLGRAVSNHIVIPITLLSRHHACFEYRSEPDSHIGKWFLNDTSVNGIKINTKICTKFKWTELSEGDVIQILPAIQFRMNYKPLRDSRVLMPSDELEHFKRKCESLETEKMAERLAFETTIKELQAEKEEFCKNVLGVIQTELECIICNDVFIQATVLGCGHTFCDSCIREWFQRKCECPICRQSSIAKSNHIELGNFLNKIYEIMPENVKKKRNDLVQERQTSSQRKMITVDGNGTLNHLLMEFNNFILAFGNRGGTVRSVPVSEMPGIQNSQRIGLGSNMESPLLRMRPRLLSRRRTIRPQPRIPPPRARLAGSENRDPTNPDPDPNPPQTTLQI